MPYLKRIGIASLFGGFAGLLCYLGSILLGIPLDPLRVIFIFVNRILIGFVIGISGLDKLKWYYHGILLGFIVGLPFFLFDIIMGVELLVILGLPFINCLFGLMIEFFTTIVFKTPQISES